MSKTQTTILAIETSCDDTSIAILEFNKFGQSEVISTFTNSQISKHKKYGGVYPELASREHLNNILPVLKTTLKEYSIIKNLKLKTKNIIDSIDYMAITCGPGLIGSLLVGTETAKTLAYIFKKPVILVNHLEGHIYSNFINNSQKLDFPIVSLIASGGHTSLILMKNHLDYKIIGQTQDDAAGEAYDKVSEMLGLGYPGGPIIDKYARQFKQAKRSNNFNPLFPRPMLGSKNFDFSFSGLKTSVLYYLRNQKKPYSEKLKQKVAYEFQEAATDVLVKKTLKTAQKYKAKSILISGGVSANSKLREKMKQSLYRHTELDSNSLSVPELKFCTDNASMIAQVAYHKILAGKVNNWYDIKANASLDLNN